MKSEPVDDRAVVEAEEVELRSRRAATTAPSSGRRTGRPSSQRVLDAAEDDRSRFPRTPATPMSRPRAGRPSRRRRAAGGTRTGWSASRRRRSSGSCTGSRRGPARRSRGSPRPRARAARVSARSVCSQRYADRGELVLSSSPDSGRRPGWAHSRSARESLRRGLVGHALRAELEEADIGVVGERDVQTVDPRHRLGRCRCGGRGSSSRA